MNNSECSLCKREVALIGKSHIIPSFMYKGLLDDNETFLIKEDTLELLEVKQTGFFDGDMLCAECDNLLLGRLEKYACEFLEGRYDSSLQINNQQENYGYLRQYKGLDYPKFKLFVLSLLWKAHISKNPFFKNLKLENEAEIIRKMIINGDPGSDQSFKISIWQVNNYEGGPIEMMLGPRIKSDEKVKIAIFFIKGYIYIIDLNYDNPSFILEDFYLKNSGELSVPILHGNSAGNMLRSLDIDEHLVQHFTTELFTRAKLLTPDLKALLQVKFPALYDFLNDSEFAWTDVSQKFHINFMRREDRWRKLGGKLIVESNLFDHILKAEQGDDMAFHQVECCSQLFLNLARHLDIEHRRSLRSTIYSLLTNYDHKFRNFTGELLVLNHLLNSGDYKLIRTKFPLGRQGDADFQLLHIPSERNVVIEILNIHFKKSASTNDNELRKFLEKRLMDKVVEKKRGNPPTPFLLIPVIWAPAVDLQQVAIFYSRNKIEIENTMEAVAYCCFIKQDGTPIYQFGTVSTLFKTV